MAGNRLLTLGAISFLIGQQVEGKNEELQKISLKKRLSVLLVVEIRCKRSPRCRKKTSFDSCLFEDIARVGSKLPKVAVGLSVGNPFTLRAEAWLTHCFHRTSRGLISLSNCSQS